MCYLTIKQQRKGKIVPAPTPSTLPISASVADTRELVGKYPHCRQAMVKFGTESKLPCKSGIDNSAPFSSLSYTERMRIHLKAKMNAPTEAPRQPRRHRIGGKFATKSQAIVADLLGFESAEAHLKAVNASKEAAKLYK